MPNNKVPIDELRRICQEPTKYNWHWYAKLGRKASIYFTKLFLKLGISANQVTLINIVVGVIAALLFSIGNYWYSISGAILLHLWLILDMADGEVARYNNKTSILGEKLDDTGSDLVSSLLYFSIGFGISKNFFDVSGIFNIFSNSFPIILGFALSVSNLMLILSRLRMEMLGPSVNIHFEAIKHKARFVANFFEQHNILVVITIGAIFNLLFEVILFYGISMPLVWLIIVYVRFIGIREKENHDNTAQSSKN